MGHDERNYMRCLTLILIFVSLVSSNVSFSMSDNKKKVDIIREKLKNIDFSDGINKEEAIIITQNYLIDKGFKLENIDVLKPTVDQSGLYDDCWVVIFNASFHVRHGQGLKWYSLDIDKKLGEVRVEGWGPS